jgi:hypothetical protein
MSLCLGEENLRLKHRIEGDGTVFVAFSVLAFGDVLPILK